jgi:hypothetical protein
MSSPLGKTPEAAQSGLRRKDSKHALTTCHGTTSSGRACRRPLATGDSAGSPRYTIRGTVLTPNNDDPAVFFCWQHKDQAADLASADAAAVEVGERTSLETVFRNLGLEDIGEGEEVRALRARRDPGGEKSAVPRISRNVNERHYYKERTNGLEKKSPRNSSSQPGSGLFASLFGCFTDSSESAEPPRRAQEHDQSRRREEKASRKSESRSPENNIDTEEPPRVPHSPSPRRNESHRSSNERHNIHEPKDHRGPPSRRDASNRRRASHDQSGAARRRSSPPTEPKTRRSSAPTLKTHRDKPDQHAAPPYRSAHSQPNVRAALAPKPSGQRAHPAPSRPPEDWLPALPAGAADDTRIRYARLLTAMSEPPTAGDEAPGYVYMFWHAELGPTAAEREAAASLVGGGGAAGRGGGEEVLRRRFLRPGDGGGGAARGRTLLLKIGRAANVHARLGQWRRRCGYAVSLLRYYPHGGAGSGGEDGRKARHVGKIEKLVHLHLEMLGKRVKRECRCGAEHREYFEIEATAKAVREVDEVITQWIEWGETRFGGE